jgi:hypothetical protein
MHVVPSAVGLLGGDGMTTIISLMVLSALLLAVGVALLVYIRATGLAL